MNDWLEKSKMKIIDLLSWLKEAQRMGHHDDDDDDEEDDIGIKRIFWLIFEFNACFVD